MAVDRHTHYEARPGDADDPVLKAIQAAPVDDEPLTPAEEDALAESYDDLRAGRPISSAEIRRQLELRRRGR